MVKSISFAGNSFSNLQKLDAIEKQKGNKLSSMSGIVARLVNEEYDRKKAAGEIVEEEEGGLNGIPEQPGDGEQNDQQAGEVESTPVTE